VRAKHPSGSTFKSKAFSQKSEGFFYGAWKTDGHLKFPTLNRS